MLIRLLSICIFSVHYGHIDYTATERESSIMASLQQHRSYSTGESLALLVVYEIVNKCVIRLAGDRVISSNSSSNKKLNEKITNRILPVLNVFIEWVQCNAKYMPTTLEVAVNSIMSDLTPKLQELVSSEHIMQILNKSMSMLLSNIHNLRGKYGSSDSTDPALARVPLPEHTELNGFLPLSDVHRIYFNNPSSSPSISQEVIAVPDDVSKNRRVAAIISLLNSSSTVRADEGSVNQLVRVKEHVMQVQAVNKVVGGMLPISVLGSTPNSSEKKKINKKTKKNHDDKRLWTPSAAAESKSKVGSASDKSSKIKRGNDHDSSHRKPDHAMDIDEIEEDEVYEEEEDVEMEVNENNMGISIPAQENVVHTMFGVPGMFNWLHSNETNLQSKVAPADTHNTTISNTNYFDNDVDDDDEEVVFRPAFSRVRSNSPALNSASLPIRGIQSQNSFGDLLMNSSADATGTWPGTAGPSSIFSNIIDTTFALLDEPESEHHRFPQQTQLNSNSFHVQPPPGFS